jgi:hypothetical protein
MSAAAEGLSTSLLASAIKTMSVRERQLLLATHATLLRDRLDTHCSFLRALYGIANPSIFHSVDAMLPQLQAMSGSADGMCVPPADHHLTAYGGVASDSHAPASTKQAAHILSDISDSGALCPVTRAICVAWGTAPGVSVATALAAAFISPQHAGAQHPQLCMFQL